MSNKFKTGDKVILVGEYLSSSPKWPVWGSVYSCAGTIVRLVAESYDPAFNMYMVNWDNGECVESIEANLQFYTGREKESLSPNLAFLKHKRKSNDKS